MKQSGITICLFLLLALVACKSDRSADADTAADSTEQPRKYKITPFSKSTQYRDAKIESMTYRNGRFDFTISGRKYKLGEQTPDAGKKMCANSAKGQHIHLIVNRQPYSAQYTSSFDYDISDGTHNLLAFLSRSYHESIKTDDAHIVQRVMVTDGTIRETEEIVEPLLFYSRPKGTYVGDDTKKVMLDFYPVNADIGGEHRVKVQVNGEVTLLDKWQPYYIEGLPMGQNTIGLALVYPDGSQVPGMQTSILQTIVLRRDPLPGQ